MNDSAMTNHLELCKFCKKRGFSMEQGITCGITGEKPAFEGECPDYELDSEEKDRVSRKREEDMKSARLTGFTAFYLYFALPVGTIVSLISFLVSFRAENYAGNPFLMACDIVFWLFYFYFSVYTIYAFIKRKADAVFFAKYQLIMVFLTNLLALLGGGGTSFMDSVPRMIASLVWVVIFFVAISTSDDVKYMIPKEKRKLAGTNKTLFILSFVLPLLLLVVGIMSAASKTARSIAGSEEVSAFCERINAELPSDIDDGLTMKEVSVVGNTVVNEYEYKEMDAADVPEWQVRLQYLSGKERLMLNLHEICSDPFYPLLADAGHEMIWRYSDSGGNVLYSVHLSNEELKRGLSDEYSYKTDPATLGLIAELFSNQLPYELTDEMKVEAIHLSDGELRYSIKFVGIEMSELSSLTKNGIKDYLSDIVSDIQDPPLAIAIMNRIPLTFDFTADCSDWWKTSVTLGPEDY